MEKEKLLEKPDFVMDSDDYEIKYMNWERETRKRLDEDKLKTEEDYQKFLEEEQFLEEELELDNSFDYELRMAFWRNDKDKKRKRTGRQGRSAENRERAKRTKWEQRETIVSFVPQPCKNCPENPDGGWIEDHRSGDVICSECGMVDRESEKGLGLSTNMNPRIKVKSKPYQKVVHFRQRMAQLLGKDPLIKDEVWKPIEKEIRSTMTLQEIEKMGKRKFSEVLKRLNIPGTKRLSANWIQARRRLGCEELPPEVTELDLLYKRLCSRYICVAHVFMEKLFSPTGERPKENMLERRNILNVNYITLQILRLENPEIWRAWAKYFPQLVSKKQPYKNNQRWKTIIETCQKRYKFFGISKTEERIPLDWEFIEFTREEINKNCDFFDYFSDL